MKHITKPALNVGIALHDVKPGHSGFVGCGEVAAQPYFPSVRRRDLMAAVNTCRRDLSLSPSVLVTLDALLSCLQLPADKEAVVTPLVLLTVYASNETLCFRAKGITDRQLRRHLDALEKAGLLQRRDSANGKRFPIMRGGKVIGAFGLDLTPLFLRAADLQTAAEQHRHQNEELRGLRARIRHLCTRISDMAQAELLKNYANLARRANLTLTEAKVLIDQVTSLMTPTNADTPAPVNHPQTSAETIENQDNTSAYAGHSVRLKEPESKTKKTNQITDTKVTADWDNLSEITPFFPEPPTKTEAMNIAILFGKMLGLQVQDVTTALTKVSLYQLLQLLDKMAKVIDSIQSPSTYLLTAVNRLNAGHNPSRSTSVLAILETSRF